MKKRLLFLMMSACILCAVSLDYISKEEPPEPETVQSEQAISEQTVIDNRQVETSDIVEPETVFTEYEYAYSCLDEERQTVYRELYSILTDFAKDMPVSSTDPELIEDVFQCVLNDHPEIFYVQGYNYTTYVYNDVIGRLTITGIYTMTPEEAAVCRDAIDLYVEECLAGIPQEASDYDKVKYVYEYLISRTEYNQYAPDNQNICSVFLNGESVCQGYAKATQYILNKAGVFCTLVIGSVSEGEGHAWNLVQMDGNYYYVDTTWGDASYQTEEGSADIWETNLPDINYDYLGVTTEQLQRTHTLNNVVPLPFCISMECNYYVKEGTYLNSCDEESIRNIFEKAADSGQEYITLKCSDTDIYRGVKRILLDEQKIFQYLNQSDGSVAYSDNDEQLSLSFWLWDEY